MSTTPDPRLTITLSDFGDAVDGVYEWEGSLKNNEFSIIKRLSGVLAPDVFSSLTAGDTDVGVAMASIVLARAGKEYDIDELFDSTGRVVLEVHGAPEEKQSLPPQSGPGSPEEPQSESETSGSDSEDISESSLRLLKATGHHPLDTGAESESETSATSPRSS